MRKSNEENEMTNIDDESMKCAEAYIEEYMLAKKQGISIDQPSYWGGFKEGVSNARIAITERLLSVNADLSLGELAATVFLSKEEVLGIQSKLISDKPTRQKNIQQLNERIVNNNRFTNKLMTAQAAKIDELQKDLTFLFKHIDALNEVQDSISALLDDAKNIVWCENDIKERNRIYSGVLKNIANTVDEFIDQHADKSVDKHIDITQKYMKIINQNKDAEDKYDSDDADDNDVSED